MKINKNLTSVARAVTLLISTQISLASVFALLVLPARADTFGSGTNTFTIDFVDVGNPGNGDDLGAGGGIYSSRNGGVEYVYRMGVTEAPQEWITKATNLGLTNVTAGAWAGRQPAANMTWYEAAAFVNWLNTSTGHQPAYDLTYSGGWSMRLWSSGQAWQAGGENLYRHKDAYYFLPSEDESYKAAWHKNDGVTANYWDYATGNNTVPTPVASGTGAGTAVYNQSSGAPPATVDNTGGLSPYGTRGQTGNVGEFKESAFDGLNNAASESRVRGGGRWYFDQSQLDSSFRVQHDPSYTSAGVGFRVASASAANTAVVPAHSYLFPGGGLTLSLTNMLNVPSSYQWQFNDTNLSAASGPTLVLSNVTTSDSGPYRVTISNEFEVVTTAPAMVEVVDRIMFISQPRSTNVPAGSNATLSVSALSPSPITYQWQFNGTDLAGQTNAMLGLTNVQLHSHTGDYRVLVSDSVSNLQSDVATLIVLVRPVITNHIQSQVALQGGTALFTVVAGPNHPALPLGYRWLRNGSGFVTSAVPFLVLTNVQASATFRVAVINAGFPSGTLSPTAGTVALTVLPDFDADGMADAWEKLHGFDTNAVADALLDFDGDKMINRDEYAAGTNPTNAASVLKLQLASQAGGQSALTFLAISNRIYSVEWNTEAGGGTWNRLQDVLAQPANRLESVTDTNAGRPMRFYRVVTPRWP